VIYRRVFYAPNIHQGGGKALLLPLLDALVNASDVMFILDERLELSEGFHFEGKVYRVKATVISRLCFEWKLRSLVSSEMLLLCMGNLPPLFSHKGIQHVFVQNRYLIDNVTLESFSFIVRARLLFERWWLRTRSRYVRNFFVQTPTMRKMLSESLGRDAKALPFVPGFLVDNCGEINDTQDKMYDFVYVASGEPHKRHESLINGWLELANRGYFPSLCLTLDPKHFSSLYAWIKKNVKEYGLNVEIKGCLSYSEVKALYCNSKAMIYPSVFESFGLPLLEASSLGLPIVASNASYVNDVISPTITFDVDSPESIADAVIDMPNTPAKITINLFKAKDFLAETFRV